MYLEIHFLIVSAVTKIVNFPTQKITDNFGEKIDNPRFLKYDERKLKRLSSRLSRTEKKSSIVVSINFLMV